MDNNEINIQQKVLELLQKVEQCVGEFEENKKSTFAEFESREKTFKEILARFDTKESTMNEIASEISSANRSFDEVKNAKESMDKRFGKLENDIARLMKNGDAISEINKRIDGIEKTVNIKLASIEQEIRKLSSDVEECRTENLNRNQNAFEYLFTKDGKPSTGKIEYVIDKERSQIRIFFQYAPPQEAAFELINRGFRYNIMKGGKSFWYAAHTPETEAFAKEISGIV